MGKIYKNLKLLVLLIGFVITTTSVSAQNIYVTTDSTFTSGFTIASGDTLFIASDASYVGTTNGDRSVTVNGVIQNEGLLVCGGIEWKNGSGQQTLNGILIALTSLKTHSSVIFTGNGTIYALSTTGTTTNITNGGITLEVAFKSWEGGTSTDWATAANWSGGTLPATTDRILISSTATNMPTLSTTAQIRSIVLLSGDELTIGSSGALTVDSFLVNNGVVNIQSTAATATGNLLIGKNYSGGGTVNVERYLPSANWHYVSSPVSGDSLSAFAVRNSLLSDASRYAIAPWNEILGIFEYFNYTSDPEKPFVPGLGYSISPTASGVATFTGTGINAGTQTLTGITLTTLGNNGYGWNLVGNPYTTSLKVRGTGGFLEDATNSATIDPSYLGVYLWNGINGDYEVIAGTPLDFSPNDTITQDEIAVGQAFFIKSAVPVGSVDFQPSMQAVNTAASFKSAEQAIAGLRLQVKTDQASNYTDIAFMNDMSLDLDPGYDVGKFKGNSNLALYSKLVDGDSDVDFAIQTLPNASYDEISIPIGVDLAGGGNATFTLKSTSSFPEGAEVYLEDTELDLRTQLNIEQAEYSVSLPEIMGAGRFNLVITNYSGNKATTGINDIEDLDFGVSTVNKIIHVSKNGKYSGETAAALYGIDGKIWYQKRISETSRFSINATSFPSGVYVLQLQQNGRAYSHKLILTN